MVLTSLQVSLLHRLLAPNRFLRMRRFLSLCEPWVHPFGRSSRGARSRCSRQYDCYRVSPHYYHVIRTAPQQHFQRCHFSCRGKSQRASTIIDELSLSSPSVALGADSTIYALSTAPGRAAIAIIRISGPACLQVFPSF